MLATWFSECVKENENNRDWCKTDNRCDSDNIWTHDCSLTVWYKNTKWCLTRLRRFICPCWWYRRDLAQLDDRSGLIWCQMPTKWMKRHLSPVYGYRGAQLPSGGHRLCSDLSTHCYHDCTSTAVSHTQGYAFQQITSIHLVLQTWMMPQIVWLVKSWKDSGFSPWEP